MAWFFIWWNYWSSLDHDLVASIWEKAISILAGNLNSGRSYLITAVTYRICSLPGQFTKKTKEYNNAELEHILHTVDLNVWREQNIRKVQNQK